MAHRRRVGVWGRSPHKKRRVIEIKLVRDIFNPASRNDYAVIKIVFYFEDAVLECEDADVDRLRFGIDPALSALNVRMRTLAGFGGAGGSPVVVTPPVFGLLDALIISGGGAAMKRLGRASYLVDGAVAVVRRETESSGMSSRGRLEVDAVTAVCAPLVNAALTALSRLPVLEPAMLAARCKLSCHAALLLALALIASDSGCGRESRVRSMLTVSSSMAARCAAGALS